MVSDADLLWRWVECQEVIMFQSLPLLPHLRSSKRLLPGLVPFDVVLADLETGFLEDRFCGLPRAYGQARAREVWMHAYRSNNDLERAAQMGRERDVIMDWVYRGAAVRWGLVLAGQNGDQ